MAGHRYCLGALSQVHIVSQVIQLVGSNFFLKIKTFLFMINITVSILKKIFYIEQFFENHNKFKGNTFEII